MINLKSLDTNKLKNIINSKKIERQELQDQLNQITNSKFFFLWQQYTTFKKYLHPKTYINFVKNKIKPYKYNLSNFETPHHDFIMLVHETDKWQFNSFEKVGEDWHIKITRKTDNRSFLLDQPFFYCLQIINNKEIDLQMELFITSGITKIQLKKMLQVIKKLDLC